MTCENCGTKLDGGICPNCSEELFIFTEQNEYLPDYLSDNFMDKVKEQTKNEKLRKEIIFTSNERRTHWKQ